jgi:hypothetical protein
MRRTRGSSVTTPPSYTQGNLFNEIPKGQLSSAARSTPLLPPARQSSTSKGGKAPSKSPTYGKPDASGQGNLFNEIPKGQLSSAAPSPKRNSMSRSTESRKKPSSSTRQTTLLTRKEFKGLQGRTKLDRHSADIRNEPSSATPSPSASLSSSSARTQAVKNLKGRRSERTRRLGVVQGRAKLNRLLGDIRNEPSSVSESKLSADEKKTKEYYVKRMKSKLPEFEKRYPGRGKEVLYATATKMAQKIAEQKSNNSAIN